MKGHGWALAGRPGCPEIELGTVCQCCEWGLGGIISLPGCLTFPEKVTLSSRRALQGG